VSCEVPVSIVFFFPRQTHDVGSVGCMKDVKSAISVARSVMEHTEETLLVGDDGVCSADLGRSISKLQMWSTIIECTS
jgi:isoaspartyl peptidase/L-asparaginase-like protein (Ntn-hydrolase superfamily)